ncbi:MAG: hypothetical protein ACOCXD_01515 [Bacteroidota bacterium]
MSTKEFNQKLDDLLNNVKIIDDSIINQFDEAYNYDAASSINWLISKLRIIKSRLESGGNLTIELKNKSINVNKETFYSFVNERYPDISKDI